MNIRKLSLLEHNNTRPLWESIFTEDTEQFLNYYYQYMTNHNNIYVCEKENEIVSMLHMNPYTVVIRGNLFPIHYIVAVATKESERKQGLMGKLLHASLQDCYDNGEPITYLMPAAEAIYTPYGFVTLAHQEHYEYTGSMNGKNFISSNPLYTFTYATEHDCALISEFVNQHLVSKYRVFNHRDVSYYQQLIHEQESQHGGIIMIHKSGELVGCFLTANEGYQQVRELITVNNTLNELDFPLILKDSPKIMIRATHVAKLLTLIKGSKDLKPYYHVIDTIIPENTGVYRMSVSYGGLKYRKISSDVNPEEALTITQLTQLVLGNTQILFNEVV